MSCQHTLAQRPRFKSARRQSRGISLGYRAVSLGYFKDMPEATQSFTKVEKEFTPNANTQKVHLEAFKRYQEYSKALAPLYTS